MSQSRDGSDVGRFPQEYRAVVERYEGQPNQCTIFPAEAVQGERTTTWITAAAPAYVQLADYR